MAGTMARGEVGHTQRPAPPPGQRRQPDDERPGLFARIRRWNPRQWGLELVLLVYAAYDGSRLLVHGKESVAHEHGELLLRTERHLGAEPEHWLNRLFFEHSWLGVPADFVYATLHYAVTPLVLVWMFRSRRAHYGFARTWLILATAFGLVGFVLFPTAPPRLLHDPDAFFDVMAQHSGIGWWGGSGSAPEGLGAMTNDFAAMPSLHFGWALWCGLLIHRHARRRWVRVLGLLYPALILVVVMGTANHYLLDCVAGGAVVLLGRMLTGPVIRLASRLGRAIRREPAAPVPDYTRSVAMPTATMPTATTEHAAPEAPPAKIIAQRGPME